MNNTNRFIGVIIAFMIGIILICAMGDQASAAYVNSDDGLRVRSEPNTESEIVRVLQYGEEIETEGSGEWVKVEDGYVCAEYVQEDNPIEGDFLGVWRVTAYAATGNACANGNYPSIGTTIAHNSLPFGTCVYIEGVGERVVEDRGPTYLGDEWCDLYLGDTGSCVQWGDQQRRVWKIVG